MTELKLYNTLSRIKETFEPEDPNDVRMYVCGPGLFRPKSGNRFSDKRNNIKKEGGPA